MLSKPPDPHREEDDMKDFWEQRYSAHGYAYGTVPNVFLAGQAARLKPGMKALVAGDGEGRNGVWLASQGLDVTSVDYAEAGLKKARALATAHGVKINTVCADLNHWDWPVAKYDVVVSIFLHFASSVRPALHAHMLAALKPGGVLIMEAFTKDQLKYKSGGPPVEDMLFSRDMLAQDFAAADIEMLGEAITSLDEGPYHKGDGAVVRLIARKK
jgi:cyclopropane fatty-acyl-phospholipid synthase-like methyltransferase